MHRDSESSQEDLALAVKLTVALAMQFHQSAGVCQALASTRIERN
jgi:hypothetical protein